MSRPNTPLLTTQARQVEFAAVRDWILAAAADPKLRALPAKPVSPRVALLIFGLAIGLGVLAATPILARPPAQAKPDPQPDSDSMTALCRCYGARLPTEPVATGGTSP